MLRCDPDAKSRKDADLTQIFLDPSPQYGLHYFRHDIGPPHRRFCQKINYTSFSFISPVNTGYCCKHNSSIISHLSERRCERTFIGVMWKKLVRSAKGGLSEFQQKSGIAPDVPIHIRSLSPTKLRLRLKAGPKLYYSLSL